MNPIKRIITLFLFLVTLQLGYCQVRSVKGYVTAFSKPVVSALVTLGKTGHKAETDSQGGFLINNVIYGKYLIEIQYPGFETFSKQIEVFDDTAKIFRIDISSYQKNASEVVITGTLKEVSKLESPVPVEVYTPVFFKKNPTPNIFDALQNVNGVRPQLNCNICNTGDIHINGLEGPNTMVLIDGMPIISSLASVYGLSGIPNSLIERIEIVKGPASSLYGSEAVGGLINIITKKPQQVGLVSADVMGTSWQELNTDIGLKLNLGKKIQLLNGLNYFNFNNRIDKNHDGFTDMALQNRISMFQKWNFSRKNARIFNLGARVYYEDRFGGDMNWTPVFRGGDSIYGESIYTKRWELLGKYELPVIEKLMLNFSINEHYQNSRYGTTKFDAVQKIAFAQLTWDKRLGVHDLLSGVALRYTYYDDNTTATEKADSFYKSNTPQKTTLPGIFVQDEIAIARNKKLLLGFRYDYHSIHGSIYTPRVAYQWKINPFNVLRLNAGSGFRVVNLFTEEHAALTGARVVEIRNELKPERSYNINLNYVKRIFFNKGFLLSLDASAFYTYFNNRIVPDYLTNSNKIIYDNLKGYAENKGVCLNTDFTVKNNLKIIAGVTYMENTILQNGRKQQQLLTEKITGTWSISYKIKKANLTIDYTGNLYGPMQLPLISDKDPRKPYSPWWSIQNLQVVYGGIKNVEIYTGIKNLLNWTPFKENNPFVIARTNDPFDKKVQYDASGNVLVTPDNPYGLTFDPTYIYAPTQGIRTFLGMRISIR